MQSATRSKAALEPFIWKPGHGYSAEAAGRLTGHFKQPKELMGEAWFMGDKRKMYPELRGDLAAIKAADMQSVIREIYSGTTSFGQRPEWDEWYHYLLPRLIQRHREAWVDSLLEYLIGAFFALHPEALDDTPYRGFRHDCFETLGLCIMDPACWQEGRIRIGTFLHRGNNNPAKYWGWDKVSGDFSASAFFCAKYLHPQQIEQWLRSMLEISDPHWAAQVMVWLAGAHTVFTGEVLQPADFRSRPNIEWGWSHSIRGNYWDGEKSTTYDFLPTENRAEILRVLKNELNQEQFFAWLDMIKPYPYLESELNELPSLFADVYRIGENA
jgi:hypothetical protein